MNGLRKFSSIAVLGLLLFNTTLITGVSAQDDVISNLVVEDLGNRGNGSDIRVTFEAAESGDASLYVVKEGADFDADAAISAENGVISCPARHKTPLFTTPPVWWFGSRSDKL